MNLDKMINVDAVRKALESFVSATPFPHCVVDHFFSEDVAAILESEFPDYDDSECWHDYKNAVEIKRSSNDWNQFPTTTYRVLGLLNSPAFVDLISTPGGPQLVPDPGLNGGGWHVLKRGGRLNPHLDYSLHPKLKLQRKLNLIVYLSSAWREAWGGHLGLWGNESSSEPGRLEKQIAPLFNRGVLFDTTMNSWHGVLNANDFPEGQYRKSIAVYYLTEPVGAIDQRGKALFAPTEEQKGDQRVRELIKARSDVDRAREAYRG